MKKFITLAFTASILIQGCGSRLSKVAGAPVEPRNNIESPTRVPPSERLAVENREKFLRLREHRRLSLLLSTVYTLQAQYVASGACSQLREVGIRGICNEASSPFGNLSPEMELDSMNRSDDAFLRHLQAERARWRHAAKTDDEELSLICQGPEGRCDTSKAFQYWKVTNGEAVNEDVEMLELAATVTEARLIARLLGTVSKEGPFSLPSNGDDPKRVFHVLDEIRLLPSMPIARNGYYEGEHLPLSSQASNRKRILEEAGLGKLEAIQ